MKPNLTIFLDRLLIESNGEIFAGYFENEAWIKGESKMLSRAHRQFKRIYSALGIHPALSASETQGRYWIVYVSED